MKRSHQRLLVAAAVAGVLALSFFVARGPLLRGIFGYGAGLAGYHFTYDAVEARPGRLIFVHPDVSSLGGEPVFTAVRADVSYNLADFRSAHPYGISALFLDRPKLTLVHHRDGSYNVRLPGGNGPQPAAAPTLPQIRIGIRDGSIGLLDDTRIFTHSRRLALKNVQLDADLDPQRPSRFVFRLSLLEEGGAFPVTGRGAFDEMRGYELSRIRARSIGLSPLLDYALNSTSLHISNGVLNAVDARFYGLRARDGTMQRHIAVTANLDHFQPYLNGLAKPLRAGRGALRVYDDGVAFPKVDGSIAGVPVRIGGVIYGFAKPALRLGITGRGELRDLLTLNDAAKRLPLAGPVAFKLFVEGAAAQPTTFAAFTSAGITYGRFFLDRPSGLVALSGANTTILRSATTYAGAAAAARGNLLVERKHTAVELFANVRAPAQRIPYAAQLLGNMPLSAAAVVSGLDTKVATRGVLSGNGGDMSLGGTFDVDANGVGTIGPLALDGPGAQSLYVRVALDRPHGGGGAAFVSARGFAASTAGPQPVLPGIALPRLPAVQGTLDADAAAVFAGKRSAVAGRAHASGVRAFGYTIDDVAASASIDPGHSLAIEARYRGSLEALAGASGSALALRGRADVPLSIATGAGQNPVVQIHDARFENAGIDGVSLDALEGTVGVRGRAFDVYSARARLGGNDVVARGSFGDGGRLGVSAGGVRLAALHAAGLPVSAGSVSAIADVGGTANAPTLRGSIAASNVALRGKAYSRMALDANSRVALSGDQLTLSDALIRAGSAVGSLDGSVNGIRTHPQTAGYAFDAHVREADVHTLAALARSPLRYPEGTLNADVRVTGTGRWPSVAGRLAIPEGSLNGLAFRDASVALAGNAADLHARGGRVTVGTSSIDFSGDVARDRQTFAASAPVLDLGDFNDYFDRGDTLGGSGSAAFGVDRTADAIATSGRIRLRHTRFRRFEVGDARADWATSGRTIHSDLALGSTAGSVTTHGDVRLAATQPLRDALHRSRIALDARARNVDLAVWLPAAGLQVPLSGSVNANATAHGTYPGISVRAHADLQNGLAQRVPIRSASIDIDAARRRASIRKAALAIDGLNAGASGSFGFGERDPIDVTVAAQTPDVGALAKVLTGKTYDAAGALQTSLHVRGTLLHPAASDVLDAQRLRYGRYAMPGAHAELAASRTRATLQRAELDLNGGRLLASGFAPLVFKGGVRIAPPIAPLQFNVTADNIDLAQFGDLLPKGSVATGLLDGSVALGGTLVDPRLDGNLALTKGSFVGPQVRSKIANLTAHATFSDDRVTIHDTSAGVGGGALTLGGTITVPDLRDPARNAAFDLSATSKDAVFNLPQYFRGRVNGMLRAVRVAAQRPVIGGHLVFTSTRIPTSALQQSKPAQAQSTAKPLDVAFDLAATAGSDVRVQGGPVDIGARGDLAVGGTLAAPTLSGEIDSTGGTISFYRTFRLQYPSTLLFDPSNGIVPDVDASATTVVENPQTDVTLHVTGPTTALNVALVSDPSYTREQILGLLVGAQTLGAVSGVQMNQRNGAQQNPLQAAAEGQLGTLLTQNILEPLSSQIGGAVGLSSLSLNYSPGGSVGIGAQKRIFKNVTAVFAQSFNYPPRESIGLRASPSDATAIQLTFFSQPSSNRFNSFEGAQSLQSTNNAVTSTQPANGSSGFSFSIQRKFR